MAGSGKPVIPSRQARRDIDQAVDWYLTEAGDETANGFVDAVAGAFSAIGRQPGIGSPRHADSLGVAGLRTWPIRRYPYLVFYMEHDDAVDVQRVLHTSRDIPAVFIEPDSGLR